MLFFQAVYISLACISSVYPDDVAGEKRMHAAAAEFEKNYGACAAVLLEADGRIVFLFNRELAVHKRFPPGSLMKPLSAAVLCENAPGFSPACSHTCRGHFLFKDGFSSSDERFFNLSADSVTGEKSFPCSKIAGHGTVSLRDALVHSCNVYFLTAARTDPRFYENLVSIWKLNDPLIPGQPYSEDVAKPVSPFQRLSAALGEGPGVIVSPLKIAQNYAALLEGTPMMEPYETGEARVRADLPLKKETLQLIRSALSGTVKDGTLSRLVIPSGCRVLAGKTGTSTVIRDKSLHHGWNALWIEKGSKRYILVSFVLKGRGSKEAAELSSVVLKALCSGASDEK
jgi:cell division protein FtsI/penicillin-binding protein 2